MPVRKLKPVEANDGSYAGMVLAAFDALDSEMPKKQQSVADLMREWRALAGLTREQAGEQLGLGATAIRDIEQGLRRDGDRLSQLGLKKLIEDAK